MCCLSKTWYGEKKWVCNDSDVQVPAVLQQCLTRPAVTISTIPFTFAKIFHVAINSERYTTIQSELTEKHVKLVAVSKTKPVADIQALYEMGQRDFGENYVQELVEKHTVLPADIRWHAIGHLQTNKARYIAPFVHMVHGVDSWKLLKELNKQGDKYNRVIDCLLQVFIAQEETKFGMDEEELADVVTKLPELAYVRVRGLMGMASFSLDKEKVSDEFRYLKKIYDRYRTNGLQWDTLSMGMSGDYQLAVQQGSNMVRIGSLLFGARE